MTYVQQYTFLDDAWHAIGWSEHTQCGIIIPFGNGYSELPDGKKAHCGPDTKIGEREAEDADPVANKVVADEQAAKVSGPVTTEPVEEPAPKAPAKVDEPTKPAAKAKKKA